MEVIKGTDPRVKTKAEVEDVAMGVAAHKVEVVEIAIFVEANTHQESALHMERHVLNAMEKAILQKCANLEAHHRVRIMVKVKDNQGLKAKNKKFNEVVQSDSDDEGQYDDYIDTKQEHDNVETLYYHNVLIQSSKQNVESCVI